MKTHFEYFDTSRVLGQVSMFFTSKPGNRLRDESEMDRRSIAFYEVVGRAVGIPAGSTRSKFSEEVRSVTTSTP